MFGFLFFDFNLFEIGLEDPPSPFGLRLFPLWKSELSFTIFETSKFDRFLLGENWPGLFSRTKGEIRHMDFIAKIRSELSTAILEINNSKVFLTFTAFWPNVWFIFLNYWIPDQNWAWFFVVWTQCKGIICVLLDFSRFCHFCRNFRRFKLLIGRHRRLEAWLVTPGRLE